MPTSILMDSPGLLGCLRGGRNYGVITAYGNLVVFDADFLSRLKELGANFDQWPETFRVKTGRVSGEGRHFYFYSPDLKEKYIFTDPEREDPKHPGHPIQLGSLQAGQFYVVGPGSKHNSGGIYTVINDVPIATLTMEQFWQVMNCIPHTGGKKGSVVHAKKAPKEPKSKKKDIDSEICKNVSSYIKCEDVAMPEPIARWNGAIAIGSHPFHGSDSGQNFHVDTAKNVWSCFRCASGGSGLELVALKHRIIRCDEAHDGVPAGGQVLGCG